MIKIYLGIVFCIAVTLSSCGGGDGGSRGPFEDITSSQKTELNGSLTGLIWETGKPTTHFNLQTQEVTEVSAYEAWPSNDGALYVEYIERVSSVPHVACFNLPIYNHRINVKNTRTHEVVNSFELDRSIIGPIRLSPDGAVIAMNVAGISDCGANDSDHVLATYSVRSGLNFYRHNESLANYAWVPDGRLSIIDYEGGRGYVLKIEEFAYLGNYQEVFSFKVSDDVIRASGFRYSPDFKHFAIELITARSQFLSGFRWRDAEVVVHSSETNSFSSVFSPADAQTPLRVNTPLFSPDSQWLLATHDYSSGAYSSLLGGTTPTSVIDDVTTVAVPAGSVSYVVPLQTQGQLVPPVQISDNMRPVLEVTFGSVRYVSFNPMDDMSWTPVPE